VASRQASDSAGDERGCGTYWDILKTNSVVEFLCDVGLQRYAETMLVNGFDDLETLVCMTDEDMKDLGIARGHAMKLRKSLRALECMQLCQNGDSLALEEAVSISDFPGSDSTPMADSLVKASSSNAVVPAEATLSAVQRSWACVEELGAASFGEMVFAEFFRMKPGAKELLPPEVQEKYWDWSTKASEVSESSGVAMPIAPQLFAKVVNLIGGAVVGLHDPQDLVPSLVRLGARHATYGVNQEHFSIMGKALVVTLRRLLGDSFTSEVELAWSIVFNFISASMAGGMQAANTLALAEDAAPLAAGLAGTRPGKACEAVSGGGDSGRGPTLLQKGGHGERKQLLAAAGR